MLKLARAAFAALIFCALASVGHAQTGGTSWRIDRSGGLPYLLQFNLDGTWKTSGSVSGSGFLGLYADSLPPEATRNDTASTIAAQKIFTVVPRLPLTGYLKWNGIGADPTASTTIPAGDISGVLSDSNLSTNIARLGAEQTFTATHHFLASGATAQESLGQILSASTPYPGLSVSNDPVRVNVGSFPFADEFYGAGVWFGNQALTAAILTPAGATASCSGPPCQDVGIAGYAQTQNAGRAAVAGFFSGQVDVAGGYGFGINAVAVNCAKHDGTCASGSAFNVGGLKAAELDLVAYDTPSGTPTGNFYGLHIILNRGGGVGDLSGSYAFASSIVPGGGRWQANFGCLSGSATGCLVVGAQGTTASSNGQNITLVSIDSGGSSISNTIAQDSTGAIKITSVTQNTIFNFATTFPQWNFNGGSNTQVGEKLYTSATSGAVTSYTMQTGSAGSSAIIRLKDADGLEFVTGSGVANMRLYANTTLMANFTAALIDFSVPLKASATPTGTPTASLCLDASGNIIKKTTAGSCI